MSIEIELKLPEPHEGQRTVIQQAKRFNVACCGRRWRKSTLGMDRLIRLALEGFPTALFCPSYKIAGDSWRSLKETMRLAIRESSEQDRRFVLCGGGSLEVWSLADSPDSGRG